LSDFGPHLTAQPATDGGTASGRDAQQLASWGTCFPYTGISFDNVAKIQPSSKAGAAGAPSPGSSAAGESSAQRLATAQPQPYRLPPVSELAANEWNRVLLPPVQHSPPAHHSLPVQQPSPVTQSQSQYSPSTVDASPQHTPAPPIANGYAEAPGPRLEPTPRMRASIACIRCRKNKTKCDNRGDRNTTCQSCLRVKEPCQYSDAYAPFRRETSIGEADVSTHITSNTAQVLASCGLTLDLAPIGLALRSFMPLFQFSLFVLMRRLRSH